MNWLDYLLSRLRPKPKPKPPGPVPPLDKTLVTLHDLHNAERDRRGADALTLNDKLQTVAILHADWMAKNRLLSHYGEGGGPRDRLLRQGYQPKTGGENIAMGYASPKAVMVGWMGSGGHRANILNPAYRHVGYGVAYAGDVAYWCAVFGSDRGTRSMGELGFSIPEGLQAPEPTFCFAPPEPPNSAPEEPNP
jgi:uncharacterized protein YkwD